MANHRASSSRKADASLDFEELNDEQRLKAALYYGITQISKEVEEEIEVKVTSPVLATLCETLHRHAKIYAVDLELFAKHGKRTNISIDDVKLLARRNTQLLEHLASVASEHASEKETRKQRRLNVKDNGRSKKSAKSGASSSSTAAVDGDGDGD